MWHKLITCDLQHVDHRFPKPDYSNEPLPRGLQKTNLAPMFSTRACDSPAWLYEIVGTKQKAPYYSPSPAMDLAPFLDFKMAAHCEAKKDWECADNAWLCVLVRDTNLLVAKGGNENAAWFSLGDLAGSVGLGWPAVPCQIAGETHWVPKQYVTAGDLGYLCITDLTDWRSWTFEWLSPAHVHLLHPAVSTGAGLVAKRATKTGGLLQTAARKCFWKFSKSMLMGICRYEGVEVHLDTKKTSSRT